MNAADVIRVQTTIAAYWPPNLVRDVDDEQAVVIAQMLPPDMPLKQALAVVQEAARKASPFPPSWPEIAGRWQAISSGVADDPDLIANEWLAEVYAHVGRGGGCFYNPMPDFSDPIIAAAVRQAAGSWRDWGATPNGGPGAEGEAFTRNLIPERDVRFRKSVVAMLRHRAQTGDRLPAIVAGERRGELGPGAALIGDDDVA